jgi:hypothetical protein
MNIHLPGIVKFGLEPVVVLRRRDRRDLLTALRQKSLRVEAVQCPLRRRRFKAQPGC